MKKISEQEELSKTLSRPIPKRKQKDIDAQFLPIAEHKSSKIYLAQTDTPHWKRVLGDVTIINYWFHKLFIPDKTKLDVDQRLHLICWAAEGMVVTEHNGYVSDDTAKEVALALHLGIPVWVLRNLTLKNIHCVIKAMQGGKPNSSKFAQVITEEEMEGSYFGSICGREILIKSNIFD